MVTLSLCTMTELRDEPPKSLEDPTEILLQQLSYYRATALAKLDGLRDDQLTASIVPSGWSPLGLLKAPGVCGTALDAVGLRSRPDVRPMG